jgi:histone H3/H4
MLDSAAEFVALWAFECRQVILSEEAAVYLCTVLEYLASEILEIAGYKAQDFGSVQIVPRYIFLAIETDPELKAAYSDIIIRESGVAFLSFAGALQFPLNERQQGDEVEERLEFADILKAKCRQSNGSVIDPRSGYHYALDGDGYLCGCPLEDFRHALSRMQRMDFTLLDLPEQEANVLDLSFPRTCSAEALAKLEMRRFRMELFNCNQQLTSYSWAHNLSIDRSAVRTLADINRSWTHEAVNILHIYVEKYLYDVLVESSRLANSVQRIIVEVPDLVSAVGAMSFTSAVRVRDFVGIERLISEGANIDSIYRNSTALIHATSTNDAELIRWLAAHGADLNLRSGGEGLFSNATNALNCAAKLCNYDAMEALLECGADINATVNNTSALMIAARHGNIDVLKLLIHRGVDILFTDGLGQSALHHACTHGQIEAAETLIYSGSDCDALSHAGITAFGQLLKQNDRERLTAAKELTLYPKLK